MSRRGLEAWVRACRRAEEDAARAVAGRLEAARREEARAAGARSWVPEGGPPAAGLLSLASGAGQRALESCRRERAQAEEAVRGHAAARAALRAAEDLLRRREEQERRARERRAEAAADDGALVRWAWRRGRV